MCGRYVIFTQGERDEINQIIREVQEKYGDDSMHTGEIFPTNNAPVYAAQEGEVQAALMTWGLPQYKGGGVIINARAETVGEKRTFVQAIRNRRCVILSSGFYEWTHNTAKKEKYLFNVPNEQILYMAGIYNLQPNGRPRFVILTTVANDSMRMVHDRMPIILQKNELQDWITYPSAADEILHRVPAQLIKENAK